jgi:4-hydroxy-2-oxoheptanedioate aldolase
VLAQLQASRLAATPVVRVPVGDVVTIKQVLDLGAQNILVPMVSSAAEAAPSSRRPLPPRGRRGVGSALALGALEPRRRLPRERGRLRVGVRADRDGGRVDAAAEIAAVDGVDGVFVGPSDLAASSVCSASRRTPTSPPACCARSPRCAPPASPSA